MLFHVIISIGERPSVPRNDVRKQPTALQVFAFLVRDRKRLRVGRTVEGKLT